MVQPPASSDVTNSVTDDECDDDDAKDGAGSSCNDHTVRFFILNNISRATSHTSDDDEDLEQEAGDAEADEDGENASDDETDEASRVELIVEQVSDITSSR